MAASFGESLLAEVHEETLDELLRDLRSHCQAGPENSTPKCHLGVKELDELLDVFMPGSTAIQPENREQALPQTEPLDQHHGQQQVHPEDQNTHLSNEHDGHDLNEATVETNPGGAPSARVRRPQPVVEISSTSSAAGKSQLLYYLAAIAVLPSTYDGMHLDGRDAAVVFIDTDGRFDADRFRAVARDIVRQKLKIQNEGLKETENVASEHFAEEIETIIITSLQHVHVFRPQSSFSLLATLQTLDSYLFDLPRHFSSNRPLHAILIDSTSAFFWQDKLRDEVARIEDIGRPLSEVEQERAQKQSFYLSDMYADLVKELKKLQKQFSCVVIFTTIAWFGKSMGNVSHGQPHHPSGPFDLYVPPTPSVPKTPSFRSSLPPPWGTFPTLRLVVQRDMVRPFPPTMTPHDAQREGAMRQEMVMQGRFSGWVNGWGREDWPRRVAEAVEWKNNGVFTFNVTRKGVDFPVPK